MGITGLLKGLPTEKGYIRDYRGKSLAVDASSWLHKSVYSIAEHYVEAYEQGRMDAKCIDTSASYITKRCIELLNYAGIAQIYLVMDGKRCPLKAVTNQERERRRAANLEDARRFKQQGRKKESQEKYGACIKVGTELTQAVVRKVKETFRRQGKPVVFVWAPYEADSQMVKLCLDGKADAIVTEVRTCFLTLLLFVRVHCASDSLSCPCRPTRTHASFRTVMFVFIWLRVIVMLPSFLN
jgi:exonuclease-1